MGVVTHFVYSWIRGNGAEPLTPNEEVTRSQWATDPETVNTVQWLDRPLPQAGPDAGEDHGRGVGTSARGGWPSG